MELAIIILGSARVILSGRGGRMTRGDVQLALCEQAQWPPCARHAGMASVSARPPAPTIPGLDKSLRSSAPWQAGDPGVRSAVTKASNCRPHPRHSYSNKGINRDFINKGMPRKGRGERGA